MSFVALAAIGVAVFVASLVSGVFGIAGGMIMLGVLLIFFDVSTAMVMFSLLAVTGNAWRVVTWPEGIYSIAKFELKPHGSGTQLVFDTSDFQRACTTISPTVGSQTIGCRSGSISIRKQRSLIERTEQTRVKYWEIIANNLKKADWQRCQVISERLHERQHDSPAGLASGERKSRRFRDSLRAM